MKILLLVAVCDLILEICHWILVGVNEKNNVNKAICFFSAFLRLLVCHVVGCAIVGGVAL